MVGGWWWLVDVLTCQTHLSPIDPMWRIILDPASGEAQGQGTTKVSPMEGLSRMVRRFPQHGQGSHTQQRCSSEEGGEERSCIAPRRASRKKVLKKQDLFEQKRS